MQIHRCGRSTGLNNGGTALDSALMKKSPTIFVLSILALPLFGGCRKKEDPVKVIEQAEAKLPPAEQMLPDARAAARSAARTASPAPAPTADAAFLAAARQPSPAAATGN